MRTALTRANELSNERANRAEAAEARIRVLEEGIKKALRMLEEK